VRERGYFLFHSQRKTVTIVAHFGAILFHTLIVRDGIHVSKPTPKLSENHWKATGGRSICLPSVNHVICTASISNRS
jgi:hypothetical protein